MKIIERLKGPVPPFFRKVRRVGLALVAAGGALMASPVTLPEALVTLGGYIVTAGTLLVALSQATVTEATPKKRGR